MQSKQRARAYANAYGSHKGNEYEDVGGWQQRQHGQRAGVGDTALRLPSTMVVLHALLVYMRKLFGF